MSFKSVDADFQRLYRRMVCRIEDAPVGSFDMEKFVSRQSAVFEFCEIDFSD
jgi:hypothetical protein